MRRLFLPLVLVLLPTFGWAQARMSVTASGRQLGFATISQKLMPDGSKSVELRMELVAGSGKVKISSETRYERDGKPTRKFQQISAPNVPVKQVIATFGPTGATVVTIDPDGRKTKPVPLVETANRASASEFWFIRDEPIKGDKETVYQFNMDSLSWEMVTTEFKGMKAITIAGKSVQARHVISDRAGKLLNAYLDEKGLPLVLEVGGLTLTRMLNK